MSTLRRFIANLPASTPAPTTEPDEPGECPLHGEPLTRFLKFKNEHTGYEHWTRWHCTTCKADAEIAAAAAQRDEARRQSMARLMHWSGLRGRFLDCTFDNFEAKTPDQQQALAAVRQYFESPDGPLWLIGPVGTGKTHLAAAGVRHYCETAMAQATIITARQLIRELRATWEKGAEYTESQRVEYFGAVPLLVLDEVGIGFGSDAELTQLFDVLDLRYQDRRPTVLLSNLAPSGIKAALGDRIYDRMREGAQLLRFEWKSHRAGR